VNDEKRPAYQVDGLGDGRGNEATPEERRRGGRLHPHSTARAEVCQPPRTVAQVLGPPLMTAVLTNLPAVSGGLVRLARRWTRREVGR
jgi:hypothetical protein